MDITIKGAETYTPEWWLGRLLERLRSRAVGYTDSRRFFEGDQPLAFASEKFAEVFGRRYRRLPANFMPRVVDAEKERLRVQGFRFGSEEPDKKAWQLWQENQLDAESQIAHEIALVEGVAYTMVAPGADGPVITIEDPCETILETAPGNRRIRLAALKAWIDDDGYVRVNLFLPTEIYKFRSKQKPSGTVVDYGRTRWESYALEGEDFPVKNPLGVVPIIPLVNRPRRDGSGRSEISPVIGNQLAINKLRFDALVASEYVAFPQRWATNIDIPTDPDSGQPISPFKPGVQFLWAGRRPTAEEAEEYGGIDKIHTMFGQFAVGDLGPYRELIRDEIVDLASISGTPYYQLVGPPTSVAPSGESIKSSEAALVKKSAAASVHLGEGWEETMRVALRIEGQTAKALASGETDWADFETRNEGAHTDAILKQYQAGLLPEEIALEELGYSPQMIKRIAEIKAAEPTPAEPVAVPDDQGNFQLIDGGLAS